MEVLDVFFEQMLFPGGGGGQGKKSKVLCLLAGSPLSCHCSVNVAKC